MLTTFYSYGAVAPRGRGEIIQGLANPAVRGAGSTVQLAAALVLEMRKSGVVLE